MQIRSTPLIICFLSLIFYVSCSENENSITNEEIEETLPLLLTQINQDNLSNRDKYYLLEDWIETELKSDSISAKDLSQVAYTFLGWDSISQFKKVNKQAQEYATINRDTFALADSHWNYGNYFYNRYEYEDAYYHYNKAQKLFQDIGQEYFTGKMLINMAYIKGRFRDYSGSETLTVRAIRKFKKTDKPKSLFACYNHLAILSKELKDYEKSLIYNEKAQSYLKEIRNNISLKIGNFNNIGIVYQQKGDYEEAIESFNKALNQKNLLKTHPALYAKIIDNITYTHFLNNQKIDVEKDFFKALRIRDSIDHVSGLIISNLHLSEYFLSIEDTALSIHYGKKAQELSKKINNNRDYLLSLNALKKADVANALLYTERYINFNDSLLNSERAIQNQITRIDLEIDEYKEETERSKELKVRILIISITSFFIVILISVIQWQRSKNKLLSFQIDQQEANEQIFMLSLEQHKKMDEGKVLERERISEELHDGVLSKLFGTRMGLGFLNYNTTLEESEKFESYIDELQKIEKEIRAISHDLSINEIDPSNLETLLSNLIEQSSVLGGFKYDIRIERKLDWTTISKTTQLHIYRIIQEMIQNVIKHAKAKNVFISIWSQEENKLAITFLDDGIGFKNTNPKSGIGLKNIKSRVKKMKGTISVESKALEGTKYIIIIRKK